jgi:Tfp pilus assembly protein PilF
MEIADGRNAEALNRLGEVVTADPKNVGALLLSARAQGAVGAHASEVASYRMVLNVDQSNLIALNNLAYVLAADDPDEALKLAQQAAEMAPDSPNVQDTLGWVYYRKGLYSMAVRYLKTAVDKESTPRRQFHLGMSYLKVGDQLTGQKIVRDALAKDPTLAKTEQGW